MAGIPEGNARDVRAAIAFGRSVRQEDMPLVETLIKR